MKKKFLSLALASAMSLTLLAGCGGNPGDSADYPTAENPLTIQVGYVPPVGELCDLTINEIKKEVEEKTGGAVLFELFPNSQLGSEKVMLDAIMGGTLDSGLISFAQDSTVVPEAYALSLPFVLQDRDHYFRVVQTEEFKEKFNEVFNQKGLTYLGVVNGSARGMISKTPLTKPEDYKGKMVRIMDSEIYADTFAAWGAGTSVMPFGECYTGLQQGVIDAIDNDVVMGVLMKFYEVAKEYTTVGHNIACNGFIINTNVWNKLSPEQQEILQTATNNGEEYAKATYPGQYDHFMEVALADYKINVHELTPEERQAFVDASQPVYDKYRDKIGAEFYDWFVGLAESQAD